ncbi:MAG: aldehyde ferredoxin oxidoreductase family protein [Anaerolineales bacterium]|nr:aldehyde ferredoxin oxidoreductase family protein [Anaerolineales bacterium]
MYGYTGQILHVDLSTGDLEIEHPAESFYRKYFGGSAVGAYYLLKNMPKGTDPLGPGNMLVLSLGAAGAPIPGNSRLTATAKSPLTNAIGDAQAGGFFPAEMKKSGFDAVVITGASETPVYLWLHDGEAELRPAEHLWGKVTGEVEAILREELDDKKIEIAQCGPSGEKLVRFANIINMSNRANGRTGLGAVMGSKKLKAVVVRGKKQPEFADKETLKKLSKWGSEVFEESGVYTMGMLGTAGIVSSQSAAGGLPTRNWSSGSFEGHAKLDGKRMAETILKERDTCFACTIRCKRVVEIEDGPYPVDPLYGGPEYETLASLGSYCCVDDLAAVSYANQLCNMYGIDTISCGGTIAWAMDCFEQGLLSAQDTDGIDLRFGNAEAMVVMTEKIAKREGFGDVLAEGSAAAARKLGLGEELLATGKGQEYPAHMPQVKRSLALIYHVNPFGADHMSHEHDPSYEARSERLDEIGLTDPQPSDKLTREKVHFALRTEKFFSFLDSYSVCMFVFGASWQLYSVSQLQEAIKAINGWDVSIDEIFEVGERRLNMLRAFNAREGITREDERIPKKLKTALKGGASDGVYVTDEEVEQAKDWYFEEAGWDVATGVPTAAKLEALGLDWVAELL